MLDRRSDAFRILQAFCEIPPYKSATVDELLLDDDFYRRPLRPEDLAFVDLSTPITGPTFDALASLMAQRILLCIHEAGEATLPSHPAAVPAWQAFHASAEVGRPLIGPLEAHAFGFLAPHAAPAGLVELASHAFDQESAFFAARQPALETAGYAEAGLGFMLIQHVPLYASVASNPRALPGAIAHIFAGEPFACAQDELAQAMRRAGLRTGRHSYWQFYLPGSLAKANLLLGLARAPQNVARYAGARLIYECERMALRGHLDSANPDPLPLLAASVHALERLLAQRLGPDAVAEAVAGASRMAALLDRARQSLGAQLDWLSDIASAEEAARRISARIDREIPDIDRDTFVEPREMCSTTHVHDEHRLVVIESGYMRFWGNVGMQHDMGPGDMILVPKGRLHGSTVLSERCTYHQPIIPDSWEETKYRRDNGIIEGRVLEAAHRG